MRGLGTIFNVALIVLGGGIGLLLGKKIKVKMQESIMAIMGVAVIMLALGGVMSKMLLIKDGQIETRGTIMMILSLIIGTIIGELLDIDAIVNRFGEWLKIKSKSTKDGKFVEAFVLASCTVCVGAMAVVGSVTDGIYGDYTILLTKGILDAVIICVMTVSMGKGSIFAAIPVGLFQGLLTLISMFIGDLLPACALNNLSYVGSVLIFCVGLNLLRDKKIRVANLLPSLIVAVAIGFFEQI